MTICLPILNHNWGNGIFETSARKPGDQRKHHQLCVILRPILLHRQSEKCIAEGSKYVHWIGLYLSFHLSWVLASFVYGRPQNLQMNEVTFARVITAFKDHFTPLVESSQYSSGRGRKSQNLSSNSSCDGLPVWIWGLSCNSNQIQASLMVSSIVQFPWRVWILGEKALRLGRVENCWRITLLGRIIFDCRASFLGDCGESRRVEFDLCTALTKQRPMGLRVFSSLKKHIFLIN